MHRAVVSPLVALLVLASPQPAAAQDPGAALTPLQVSRIERLLETRIACRGCHQIDGRGGLIGPVLDGIANRADLNHVLAMIESPAEAVPGTIMPHQPLPDREAERLARYVIALPAPRAVTGAVPEAPPALAPGQEADGTVLYARHCAACHGDEGRGDGWNAANLPVPPTVHADAQAMAQRPDDTLFDGIYAGGFVLDKSPLMPAFGDLLDPGQIRALVGHIRSLCECRQPAWAGGER